MPHGLSMLKLLGLYTKNERGMATAQEEARRRADSKPTKKETENDDAFPSHANQRNAALRAGDHRIQEGPLGHRCRRHPWSHLRPRDQVPPRRIVVRSGA